MSVAYADAVTLAEMVDRSVTEILSALERLVAERRILGSMLPQTYTLSDWRPGMRQRFSGRPL